MERQVRRLQQGLQALEVFTGLLIEVIGQLGRVLHQGLHRRILRVKGAQRIAVQPAARVLVQLILMGFEVTHQFGAMLGACPGIADGIDMQFDFRQPQRLPQAAQHDDLFRIDIGAGKRQRLGAELVELPVAAFLRPLVAEHRALVVQLLRTVIEEIVLQRCTHAAGSAFGS